MKLWRQQDQPWISESTILIQIHIPVYLKIDNCQDNRKLCIKHRHLWVAYSCHMWGVSEDLVLFERTPHSMQLFSHFWKNTSCALPVWKQYCHLLEYMPIAMAPVLSWKVSSCTSTSGVCQDSFRNPGAGKSRICQNNGLEGSIQYTNKLQLWDSHQLLSSKWFFQGDTGLCWGKSSFSDWWFDILWTTAHFSSWPPPTMQWWFCLSEEPP